MEPGLLIVLMVAILHTVLVDSVSIKTRSTTCGQVFDSKSDGVIKSPNFPGNYPESTNCHWTIKIPKGHQMTLKFKAFMLEESPNCENAYLEIAIRNNVNDPNQKVNRYCGSNKPTDIETSNIETVLTLQTGSKSFSGFDSSFRSSIQIEQRKAIEIIILDLPASKKADNGTCNCGVVAKSRRRRIVGGPASPVHKWPYLVLLIAPKNRTYVHCGGALISPKWVVTASHCLYNRTLKGFSVIAGAHDLQDPSSTQRKKLIKKAYLHEKYEPKTEKNDIALLELESPFELNSAISTICLPPQGHKLEGQTGVVAGYGRKSYSGAFSMIPQEIELPIVSYNECVRSLSKSDATINKQMLCAGVLNGSKDTCQGDSGGPLMWLNGKTNRYYLIGITSFGVKCATKNYYGVYTKVSEYNQWINDIIGESQCPKK